MGLGFAGLIARTAQLQVNPDPRTLALLDRQTSPLTVHARRGDITDRHGRLLATSARAQRLFADPALIVDFSSFGERVGYQLGVDPAQIDRTLGQRLAEQPRTRYVPLLDPLTDDQAAALPVVDQHGKPLAGLATQTRPIRHYPQGPLAGQLLGFVGVDHDGLTGLEAVYDDRLTGTPGSVRLLRDAARQPMWTPADGLAPPTDGQPLALTLDATIQAIAEQTLARTIQRTHAVEGQIVVADPQTGQLLAIANYPPFDPATFADPATRPAQHNRAATDVFEPGSIFKPLVWAGLTQRHAARPDDLIDCERGRWRTPYGRTLTDVGNNPPGKVPWDTVLIKSSNIGMAKVAARVSPQALHDIAAAYGIGQLTGADLPYEAPGLLHAPDTWSRYTPSSIPMGYEVAVTPLQIIRAYCALASDGSLPHLSIVLHDPAAPPVIQQRVLTPAVALHTRDVLRRVVTEGSGTRARSDVYTIFGKTGTAELPRHVTLNPSHDVDTDTHAAAVLERGYYQNRYLASFVGGAPFDQPRLVVGCFITDPTNHRPDYFGGHVSAPAVKEVLERSLAYLGVPADQRPDPDDALAHAD
jgi:cell division protein FtsI (penicillin-binding protein 3)